MSASTMRQMSSHRSPGLRARLRDTLEVWRRRAWERESLVRLDERDLHELGLSRAAAEFEASKPFWRA